MGSPPVPKKPIVWLEIPCEGNDSLVRLNGMTQGELYRSIQIRREDRWRSLVLAYEEDPEDFLCAWTWLNEHPLFYQFHREFHERGLNGQRGILDGGVEVVPTKVQPRNRRHSEDPTKNTLLQFWVEVFPCSIVPDETIRVHDYERDTGADTYEEAIVKAAKEIYAHHGNDRAQLEKEWRK